MKLEPIKPAPPVTSRFTVASRSSARLAVSPSDCKRSGLPGGQTHLEPAGQEPCNLSTAARVRSEAAGHRHPIAAGDEEIRRNLCELHVTFSRDLRYTQNRL